MPTTNSHLCNNWKMSFNLLFLVLASCFSFGLSATCPEGMYYEEILDRCFSSQNFPDTFLAADRFCQSMDAHLVTIRNSFENAIIAGQQTTNLGSNSNFWIGANLLLNENNWEWIDNEVFNYTNWLKGEPIVDALCGTMVTNTGQWRSSSCNNKKPYVCASSPLPPPVSTTPPTTPKPCTTSAPCPKLQICNYYCPSGSTYFDKTNSCYKVFFNGTIPEAEEVCKQNGAHLTSVHSDEENEFIVEIATASLADHSDYQTFIGVYRNGSTNSWLNYDGTTFDYHNWAPGEPNNKNNVENCVQLFSDASGGSYENYYTKWNDCPCDKLNRNFVCKKPALK